MEAGVAYFYVCSCPLTEGSKRNQENPQNSRDLSNTKPQIEVKLSLYPINPCKNVREMKAQLHISLASALYAGE
jgi:hypothetical protein